MPDSTADKFIGFLQSKFARSVDIPRTTDVLRIAEFPGLESKRKQAEPAPDFSSLDAGMMSQESEGIEQMPLPGSDVGSLTGDDDELV